MKNFKTIVCIVLVLVLSASMIIPAMAENEYVPSITYKQSVFIKEAELDGEDVLSCLVVTNIEQAREKETDITQEARDLLTKVYKAVVDGSMEVPVDEGFVVRELVDISFMEEGCVKKENHNDKPETLEKDGTVIKLVLELGVTADTEVVIYAYVDDEWIEAEEIKNNGDGTVNVTFEDLCPVAIAVK